MFDHLLTEAFLPFTISLGLLAGLTLMELLFALLGGTLLGLGGDSIDIDGPDIDAPEFDLPDLGDLDIDLDGIDTDAFELPSFEEPGLTTAPAGPSDWLGFGRMPALIWLGTMALAFGLVGITVQNIALALLGSALPAWSVAIPALAVAIWFTRGFGALFARLLPKNESQSVSERHLGRRKGVVSQGTAARGRPAEIRVSDRYGNTHYIRAEPLRDDAVIPQGTEVIVLRHRYDSGYMIVALTA
ncbi:MAG: YqiJ family protein [Pelagimonas sp.]|jgi:hypothetical protein|nr:YqiJ family protein [Pelagimonas sp.]